MSSSMGRGVRRAWIVALSVFLLAFAACGGDDSTTTDDAAGGATTTGEQAAGGATTTGGPAAGGATTTGDEGAADTSAYLRPLGVRTETEGLLDPAKARARAWTDVMRLVYDTLMRPGKDGELEPGLAKSAEVVDPQTIRIELQSGVKFSDGSPFDANAVKAGLERNIASENFAAMRAEIFSVTEITVDSPTTLTLKLDRPVAGAVLTYTTSIETIIIAPSSYASPDANPVGAGPFMLEEYSPGRVFKLKKNPTYFQADRIKVAGLDFNPATDPAAIVNGLRSGEIDVASQQSVATVASLQNDSSLNVTTQLDAATSLGLNWCKNKTPLDDVRVRRALAMAIDREAINDSLYGGTGEVTWGLYPKSHPFHDPSQVNKLEHDPEGAKRLLAEAGYPNGFDIGMIFITAGDPQRAAEIVQAQWSTIGVRLTLHPTTDVVTDFYQQVKQPILMLFDTGGASLTYNYGRPGAISNVCQYTDPAFITPLNKVPELTYGSKEHIAQWAKVGEVFNDQLVRFPLLFPPRSVVSNTRVGGIRVIDNYAGSPVADLFQAYVLK